GIGSQLFARKVIQGGRTQLRPRFLVQDVLSKQQRRNHEILSIELESHPVVLENRTDLDIKFCVVPNLAEVQDPRGLFDWVAPGRLLLQSVWNLFRAVVKTDVRQV